MANNVKYDGDDSKIIEDVYIPEESYGWLMFSSVWYMIG